MSDAPPDPRLDAILTAAWQAFAAYGYRKTSMDDIARGAGVSRPALYLRFRNKEDIFRQLVQVYFETAADAVRAALEVPGRPAEVLERAFAGQGGPLVEALMASTHGMELMDAKTATAADVVETGMRTLAALYAGWLERAAAEGRIRPVRDPAATAATLLAALNGLKDAAESYAGYRGQLAELAALIGAGLEPQGMTGDPRLAQAEQAAPV